jgi:hypothetical protein
MESNVVVLPLYTFPVIRHLFPKDQWERYRIFSNASLARVLPRMGENIILFAEKRAEMT